VANAASTTLPSELNTGTEQSKSDLAWRVGLGAALVPDYEGSKTLKAAPAFLVAVKGNNNMSAELVGTTLRANIVPADSFRFGPVVRYRMGRKDVENARVDRMRNINGAVEMGAFIGYDVNNWSARLEATHDTSGVYNGAVVSASLGYTWMLNPVRLTLSGFTTYADINYMNTYFGVNDQNRGTSGFKNWSPSAGLKDLGAMMTAGYMIDKHWGLTGVLRYAGLLNDAADSPLVHEAGRTSQVSLGVLATYSF
jgi:outer membrane scaffolding protein for murein synthesis (MipA/OmpV family)